MDEKDIQVGRVYEAKRKKGAGFPQYLNDRVVTWISADRSRVQYDSPTVPLGRKMPTVDMQQFCKWAARDCTDDMPEGEWRTA